MDRAGAVRIFHAVPKAWKVWSALVVLYLVWGSTYLAIRVMVESVPPLLGAGMRFLIAGGLVLALVAWRRGLGALRPSRRTLLLAAVIGLLLPAGGNGLVTVAEQDVPSGLAALLVASEPLFVVLFRALGRDRPTGGTLAGVVLGFAGVALLLLPGARPDEVPLGPSLLVVVAAISWALGSVIASRDQTPQDPLAATGWQMLFGGLILTVAAGGAGEVASFEPAAVTLDSALAFAWLVVAGSILAYTAYAFLLSNAPISKVSTYAYVNPVVAVLLGAWLLDEVVAGLAIGGMALVVASVAWTVRDEGRQARRARAPAARPAESVA